MSTMFWLLSLTIIVRKLNLQVADTVFMNFPPSRGELQYTDVVLCFSPGMHSIVSNTEARMYSVAKGIFTFLGKD